MDNDDSDEDPMIGIIKMLEARNKFGEKIKQQIDQQREDSEKKIMMWLWSEIDNNTESYHHAFQAVTGYTKMINNFRKNMRYVHTSAREVVVNAFIEQIKKDLELDVKLAEMHQEFEKELKG